MIVVRIAGGLGNQLFQVAVALYLSNYSGKKIIIDTSGLTGYEAKRNPDVLRLLSFDTIDNLPRYNRIFLRCLHKFRVGRLPFPISCNDNNVHKWMTQRMKVKNSIILLDGYFQQPINGYNFNEALNILKSKMCIPDRVEQKKFDCIMHVRGTDYLSQKQFSLVDASYYIRGINLLRKTRKIMRIGIVTDDVTYAKILITAVNNVIPDVEFFLDAPSYDIFTDFFRIRDASARVIPNSTFSWWATALDNNRAITISPLNFTRSQISRLVLNHEILIDVP